MADSRKDLIETSKKEKFREKVLKRDIKVRVGEEDDSLIDDFNASDQEPPKKSSEDVKEDAKNKKEQKASKQTKALLKKTKASKQTKEPKKTNDQIPDADWKRVLLPEEKLLTLEEVVISSKLLDSATEGDLTHAIISEFNKNVPPGKSCFTNNWLTGKHIPFGSAMIAICDGVPEMCAPCKNRVSTRAAKLRETIINKGIVDLSSPFSGTDGVFVLNVPNGSYAKAKSGTKALLYGSGTHVIHDKFFSFDQWEEDSFVLQTHTHIHHQDIHIVRVSRGMVAKIILDGVPYLLMGRDKAYVIRAEFCRIDKKDMIDSTKTYIRHKDIHVIRVPAGKLVKIFDGSRAALLEARDEPYIFRSATLSVVTEGWGECLYDAREPLITHGHLKRVFLKEGEVAVSYDAGKLKILRSRNDGSPILIDSAQHQVEHEFLHLEVQHLSIPSEKTKKTRLTENKALLNDEVHYDIYFTKETVKVAIQLGVMFKVDNPELACKTLGGHESIRSNVEKFATKAMREAVQRHSFTDLMDFTAVKPEESSQGDKSGSSVSAHPAPSPAPSLRALVTEALHEELKAYGIALVQSHIHKMHFMDKDIQISLEKKALAALEARMREVNAREQARLKLHEEESQIAVIRMRADAERYAAEVAIKTKELKMTAEMQVLEKMEKFYQQHPMLKEIALAEARAKGFAGTLFGSGFLPMQPHFEVPKLKSEPSSAEIPSLTKSQ